MKTEIAEALREWLQTANPGLVTRDDLMRVEARLDELLELTHELQQKLTVKKSGGKRPRRRP